MAKLSSCYPLCPLIGTSPLGVTSDSNPGCAIVTLGKNIVIRYQLADQKQASSWSSKDKLSAPVIYDNRGKRYIAVFNQIIVRLWDNIEVDLNKEKKLKFDLPIFSILNHISLSEPVVIFRNGAAISISTALDNRRKLWHGPLSSETAIKECWYINFDSIDCITVIAVEDKGQTVLDIVKINQENESLLRVVIKRSEKRLLGQTVMQTEHDACLFTLWDDGQLFSLPLKKTTQLSDGVGSVLYTVRAVSTRNLVAMTQVSSNHLAIYGADPNDEGALLAVLNTQFMLVQARQHYKLFSESANLWIIGTNILLVVGHSLAVVPFLLGTERLCALIGSHKPLLPSGSKGNEVEQILKMEEVTWNDGEEDKGKIGDSGSSNIHSHSLKNWKGSPEIVNELISQGYSQAMLCEKLMPSLLHDRNISVLLWLLNNLADFPETALVQILLFCLDTPSEAFKEVNYMVNSSESESMEIGGEDSGDGQNTLVELSSGQQTLLNIIINTQFSDIIMLPHLRSKLNLSKCLVLLQYVAQNLPLSRTVESAHSLLRWAAILLDSHYQQLLLSKDECVASTIIALKELTESQIEYMEDMKMCHSLLEAMKSPKPRTKTNNFYSIETLHLY